MEGIWIVLTRRRKLGSIRHWELFTSYNYRWVARLHAWLLRLNDPWVETKIQWHPDGVTYISGRRP